jgi:hypothetical protein
VRNAADDLTPKGQVADIILADPERELVGFGPGEETRYHCKGVVNPALRYAVIDSPIPRSSA